jgi:alpha-L-fucosidase 2
VWPFLSEKLFSFTPRENPNPLFSFVDAGKPIIKYKTKSNAIPTIQGVTLDFKTEKGKQYVLK